MNKYADYYKELCLSSNIHQEHTDFFDIPPILRDIAHYDSTL